MEMEVDPKKQKFEYLIMMDFESTCIKDMRINPQEIIEFPATIVRTADYAIVDRFHTYVRPVYKPKLSPFCIKLTGIKQHDVDTAPVFSDTLREFRKFLDKNGVSGKKSIFVTCGDWDLETMLPSQCGLSNEDVPNFMKSWINIKKEYERITKRYIKRSENDLKQMMAHYEVPFSGKLHCGIDDVHNLVQLVLAMCKGDELKPTTVDPTWGNECVMPPVIDERGAQRRKVQESMDTSEPKKTRGPELDPDIRSKLHNIEGRFDQLDYMLILDFEATCLKDMKVDPREIVEFPCLVLDMKEKNIVSRFHAYVRPMSRPRLSPFCIKLTHIPQNLVDNAEDFPTVYRRFLHWLEGLEMIKGKKWTFACLGNNSNLVDFMIRPWDLNIQRWNSDANGNVDSNGMMATDGLWDICGRMWPQQPDAASAAQRPTVFFFIQGLDANGPDWFVRSGAQRDVDLLKRLCDRIGWNFCMKSDLTKAEFRTELDWLKSSSGPIVGMEKFALIVEGHGGTEAKPDGASFIWDKNRVTVALSWFEDLVKWRRPLFRNNVQLGINISCKTPVNGVAIPESETLFPDRIGAATANHVQVDSACIWAPSYRHRQNGTLFMQEFCAILGENPYTPMGQVVNKINRRLNEVHKERYMKVTNFTCTQGEDFRFEIIERNQ